MELNIRGDKLVVTKAIKDYVTDKMSKLDKYFEEASKIKASILIKVKNDEQIIEVTVPTSKFTLRAEEKHNDLYAAIDLVTDKLERQIRKNKTRLNNKFKNIIQFDINTDIEATEDTLNIIKRKNITTKPMDEEEAILQMELLNHDFFVFKNIDEECVSVIYKRKDNDYGIINVK
ncbi:MAG: ribosome-associated translation inhibitor RaiA [Bacilli bacterium]|jgi:putative sigma-54 modulation protein|nr:ribosome-associated translation inhibitor RaiA [Bacilli bacterium]